MILLVPIGPCFFDFSIKRLSLISRLGLFAKFLTLQLKHCQGSLFCGFCLWYLCIKRYNVVTYFCMLLLALSFAFGVYV
jgi:hypothetical protein